MKKQKEKERNLHAGLCGRKNQFNYLVCVLWVLWRFYVRFLVDPIKEKDAK